jgi:hypothetical protein
LWRRKSGACAWLVEDLLVDEVILVGLLRGVLCFYREEAIQLA